MHAEHAGEKKVFGVGVPSCSREALHEQLRYANGSIRVKGCATIQQSNMSYDKLLHSLRHRIPLIVHDGARKWDAFEDLAGNAVTSVDLAATVDQIAARAGRKKMKVTVGNTHCFGCWAGYCRRFCEGGEENEIKMSIRKFFKAAREGGHHYYVQPSNYEFWKKVLGFKLRRPPWVAASAEVEEINVWAGAGETITAAHWDDASNVLLQVRGQKKVHLADILDSSFLYGGYWKKSLPSSPVDLTILEGGGASSTLLNGELELFPKARHAQISTCVLEQGDALIIPAYTWHQVVSSCPTATRGGCPHIAANFWFKPANDHKEVDDIMYDWAMHCNMDSQVLFPEDHKQKEKSEKLDGKEQQNGIGRGGGEGALEEVQTEGDEL
eukprot:gnl/MRDRNA2_/MRDRNA2_72395_c0_seq1.p1 gnl/MRDRNA2_/MRDRNA2_72395_c0~~gnl/MRDRNA2_/MRDRNA2_72395_c0_seq1.p1  ORF type:complete len:396 (+),score=78.43 gnl/MRDRNA2_/MRDRNA2_72395_c0_seq1:43-1188(+)